MKEISKSYMDRLLCDNEEANINIIFFEKDKQCVMDRDSNGTSWTSWDVIFWFVGCVHTRFAWHSCFLSKKNIRNILFNVHVNYTLMHFLSFTQLNKSYKIDIQSRFLVRRLVQNW